MAGRFPLAPATISSTRFSAEGSIARTSLRLDELQAKHNEFNSIGCRLRAARLHLRDAGESLTSGPCSICAILEIACPQAVAHNERQARNSIVEAPGNDVSPFQGFNVLAPNRLLQLQRRVIQLGAIKFLILRRDIRPRPQMQLDPITQPQPRR